MVDPRLRPRPRPSAARERVDLSLDRFERALRAARMGTWRWDIGTGFVDWDAPMEELFGFSPGTFTGAFEDYLACLHPDDRPELEKSLRQTLAKRLPEYTTEHRIVLPDSTVRWVSSTAALELDGEGNPAGLIGVTTDVTRAHLSEAARDAAERAESHARAVAEQAQRRLSLFARFSRLLAVPLDVDVTIQQVADLAVEDLADWCLVEVEEAPGRHRFAVAHRDPSQQQAALRHRAWWRRMLSLPRLQAVRDTLEPLVVDRVDDHALEAITGVEDIGFVDGMGITGVVAVPLVAEGRGIGTLALILRGERHLHAGDVGVVVELGRRAGSAVEKARLYRDRDRVARTLQRSLSPPPLPPLPGVDVAAAYRPWTAGVDVGGDYYDVFHIAGRWWAVLGDVCGKGPAAAALTTAVRYSLRALTLEDGDPVSVLTRLNEVLLVGEPDTSVESRFTTLVLARLRPAGTGMDVELASAGHPPPLLRRAGGRIETVTIPGMPVGLFPELELGTTRLRLDRGDTLLLYTDGATEARDASGEELGEAPLRRMLAEIPVPVTAQSVIDQVMSGVLLHADGLRDDLALLALSVPETVS
ncbi:MAG: SpoIIE family protein phosphatase [Actinomycetota bacterium]|nr:SpoIIE family protein phosphatase [Actinomycetota bacterium]